MKKTAIVMLIIVVIIVLITLALKACDRGNSLPSVDQAGYQVIADSRVYYTDDYEQGVDKFGQYITLNGYYLLDGEDWEYHNDRMYLSYRGYTSIIISKRE